MGKEKNMSNLRTNYKDDVFSGSRKYRTVNNADGTVSFTDETTYTQRGDTYGAAQINQSNEIINSLDNNAYKSTDAAMTDIADNDYIPVYDTSASTRKKALWSTLKSLFTQTFAIKVHDSNSAGTYGAGTSSRFGHVKLSDSYDNVSPGSSSQSVGASEAAVCNAYDALANNIQNVSSRLGTSLSVVDASLVVNNNHFYFDYHDGKYGYNTSSRRGADTFFPFNRPVYKINGFIIRYLSETQTAYNIGEVICISNSEEEEYGKTAIELAHSTYESTGSWPSTSLAYSPITVSYIGGNEGSNFGPDGVRITSSVAGSLKGYYTDAYSGDRTTIDTKMSAGQTRTYEKKDPSTGVHQMGEFVAVFIPD